MRIMKNARYLLHFVHEHISFRWTEFLSLTSKWGCKFKLISKAEHIKTRPFIIIELEDEGNLNSLLKSARESVLLKNLYELWACSDHSPENLAENVARSPHYLSNSYSGPEHCFRVNCESFGTKLRQSTKVEWIKKMIFLENYQCKPDLSNPKQIYCIFEMNERLLPTEHMMKEYYFGRLLTTSDRATIHNFSLKKRIFIGNTSMDPLLSLIAVNSAKVKPNDIVYDPFVGSGSLLVAAAYKGAYVIGSDIDWQLLHGKSRPTRKGDTVRQAGESVRANLVQYNLQDRYIDVMVSDITRYPLKESLEINSIISDPPYGVRECSEKIGVRKERPVKEYKIKYPSKTSYTMKELFGDLLNISTRHLSIGGRLVYYLPVTRTGCVEYQEFIPRHPCLELISYGEQELTAKVSRLMVVMEKKRHPIPGDVVDIPQIISDMNFRDTYFSSP